MQTTQYLKIGGLGKSFGKDGKVRFFVEESYEHLLDKIDHIYVWERGQYVPYFIDKFDDQNEILVKFEDLNDIDKIANIANKEIFVSDLQININEYQTDLLLQTNELIGFTIFDQNSGISCIIRDIKEYPGQNMLLATREGSEEDVLIPFVEDWLMGIDPKHKEIVMNLPSGLLDMDEEE